MNKMQTAKGSVDVEAPEKEFPTDSYFDFVECFAVAWLSMGALTRRGSLLVNERASGRNLCG